jgi:hypothetical protein
VRGRSASLADIGAPDFEGHATEAEATFERLGVVSLPSVPLP